MSEIVGGGHEPPKKRRKSLRLPNYDYSQGGAYYVTICTHNRQCILGKIELIRDSLEFICSHYGSIASNWCERLEEKFDNIELDEFVLMPNHIHAIIFINESDKNVRNVDVGAVHELPLHKGTRRRNMLLPRIIGYFKMNSAKEINRTRNTPGTPVWQRNHYEHIVRDEEDLSKIREYVRFNPARWIYDEENPSKSHPYRVGFERAAERVGVK